MKTFRDLAVGDSFIREDKFNLQDEGVLLKIENQNNYDFKAVYITGSNKGKYCYLLPEEKVKELNYFYTYSNGCLKITYSHQVVP